MSVKSTFIVIHVHNAALSEPNMVLEAVGDYSEPGELVWGSCAC